MRVSVEPDKESFERVIRALDNEADGKKLIAQLGRDLHAIMEPAAAEARSNVMAYQTGGLPHAGEPLRPAVASAVHTYVELGEHKAVVGLEADKIRTRKFFNAPKRLNERKGWRHPTFGGKWVTQMGAPGWFDRPVQRRQAQLKKAAQKCLQDVADRISRRA
jgi:hypothetical protein